MEVEKTQNNNLKCVVCQNYLNVAPVLTSEDGKISKCGRCQLKGPALTNRNSLYESIGANLSFPCAHEDCPKRMGWTEVQRHERTCSFRRIKCPFWNCRGKDITFMISSDISHFEQSHPGTVHKDALNVSLQNVVHLQSYMKLLTVDDVPFLVLIHCIKYGEMVLIGVFNFDSKIYNYEIKLSSEEHDRRYVIFKERVLLYTEESHCLYCLQNLCELRDHKYSKVHGDVNQKDKYKYFAKVDALCVKNVLLSKDVVFDISIVEVKDK